MLEKVNSNRKEHGMRKETVKKVAKMAATGVLMPCRWSLLTGGIAITAAGVVAATPGNLVALMGLGITGMGEAVKTAPAHAEIEKMVDHAAAWLAKHREERAARKAAILVVRMEEARAKALADLENGLQARPVEA